MAETRYDPLSAEQKRQALDADNAPPRQLAVHKFVYEPHADDPEIVGLMLGHVDMHGNPLVPASLVVPEHPLCARVVRAGIVIQATEKEPQLLNLLRTHRSFRRARLSDLKE
jgi:hypothetical protein